MRADWITRGDGKRLILYFGGWGMDERSVSHLTSDSDVLAFHDYRDIASEPPDATGYEAVDVVA